MKNLANINDKPVRPDFLPFSRPSVSEDEISSVADVLRSGWITTGSKTSDFEEKFCRYTGCRGAVALTSATAGMHLMLKSLGIGPGDEVITPSLTWVSTPNLIVLSGAKPVFAEVDRGTLMVSADSVKECITSRTKAIIPVHFAGAPADMAAIRKVAAENGIPVVEDAAHALGTEYMGDKIGLRGTSIFSFHPIKNITTGEGGMFCSDDDKLLDHIRRLKFHGLGVDAYDRKTQGRVPQAEVIEPGYKYNMTDISAVLGLGQLARVDAFNKRRTELAERYLGNLSGMDEIQPLALPVYPIKHAWHLFIVRLNIEKAGLDRDKFMSKLKGKNIGTGIHFIAAHLQKYYRETLNMCRGMLPDTEWNSDRIVSLPLFPAMRLDDVDYVTDAIRHILHGGD